jgi:hypothetical protein
MIPQNNKEIDIWATAFTDIIDITVQQTIEWIDQPNPLLTPKSWDNADTLQGQYVIPPTNMISPLTLPKVLYKDKIKLNLFKKLVRSVQKTQQTQVYHQQCNITSYSMCT